VIDKVTRAERQMPIIVWCKRVWGDEVITTSSP
jgi:hypothetical protein